MSKKNIFILGFTVTAFINKLWNILEHQCNFFLNFKVYYVADTLYILNIDKSALYTADNCIKRILKRNSVIVENSITVFFFMDSSYYLLLQFLNWYSMQVQMDTSPIAKPSPNLHKY